jgi:hypothetical protein
MTDLNTIFMHFSPQDIEEFYQLYQLWSLRKKRAEIVAQMHELEQHIVENEALLTAVSPSAIAQAALSQFRASGVDDIDLLDSMLERGDEWLDHTLQLLERCERMDMLQGNATQWCAHALEGAYDWIESMGDINEPNDSDDDAQPSLPATSTEQPLTEVESLPLTTEADFLQKLMSEDEITSSVGSAASPCPECNPTAPHGQGLLGTAARPCPAPTDENWNEQPADTEQKPASQTRKRKKTYSSKHTKKRTKRNFKRYKRRRARSHS